MYWQVLHENDVALHLEKQKAYVTALGSASILNTPDGFTPVSRLKTLL